MKFQPGDWFSTELPASRREAMKMLGSGVAVWVLAWLIVWWNQDSQRVEATALSDRQKAALAVFREGNSDSQAVPQKAVEAVTGQPSAVELPTRSLLHWLATMIGFGLFWAGGILVFRPTTAWGWFAGWLARCRSVERLALVAAASLTLAAIVCNWIYSLFEAWMLAAVLAVAILATAFRWKLPKPPSL